MLNDSTTEFDLTPEDSWDVVVIGAGPAGSMAAIQLAQKGLGVLLLEKAVLPRYKICGCCLNARAVKLLDSIGVTEKLLALNAVPSHALELHAGMQSAEIRIDDGLAVSRSLLDFELVKHAVACGVRYQPSTKATVLEAQRNGNRSVMLEKPGAPPLTVSARCVLVADGLNGHSLEKSKLLPAASVANSRIGAGVCVKQFPAQYFKKGTIYMTCAQGGYVGMVLLEDGSLDIAAAFDKTFIQSFKNVGAAANKIIASTKFANFDLEPLDWQGTPPLTRRRQKFSAPGIFVIGDAAAYAEPFTGEGMSWALLSACAVAPLVELSLHRDANFQYSSWDILHAQLLSGKHYRSMALAHFLRHPRLVEMSLSVLSAAPKLASPIVCAITGGSARKSTKVASVSTLGARG